MGDYLCVFEVHIFLGGKFEIFNYLLGNTKIKLKSKLLEFPNLKINRYEQNLNTITYRIFEKIRRRIAMNLCEHRNSRLVEFIINQVSMFLKEVSNVNWNMNTNGEIRVLRLISRRNPAVAFDVGANRGEWSSNFGKMVPSCKIYAFEIVPDTFLALKETVDRLKNVVPVNSGLSDLPGKIFINVSDTDSTVSTAYPIRGMAYHDRLYTAQVQCSVTTGNEFMRSNGIGVIDFLKIDVEGMDFAVLEGFGDKLKDVKIIQFEYGVFNIPARKLLIDFFDLLTKYGFVVGKIFPKNVVFFEYHFRHENFYGGNFIAVKKDDIEFMNILSK